MKLLPLVILLIACKTVEPQNYTILGTWESLNRSRPEYMCFNSNGKMHIGHYDTCDCEPDYEYEIRGDTLILKRGGDVLKSEIEVGESILRMTTLFPNRADVLSTYRRRK